MRLSSSIIDRQNPPGETYLYIRIGLERVRGAGNKEDFGRPIQTFLYRKDFCLWMKNKGRVVLKSHDKKTRNWVGEGSFRR